MRFALAAFAAGGLACLAFPADAADEQQFRALDIAVRGEIAQHCALGSVRGMDFGDISRPGLTASAPVRLSCNVPFNMTIEAENGGLAHQSYPQGQGPYSGKLGYLLGVSIPTRRPASSLISKSFESRDLTGAGKTVGSEGGIAVDDMMLSVALERPSGEAGLLGGQYFETIRITVAPS
jgi:hypothetical protein